MFLEMVKFCSSFYGIYIYTCHIFLSQSSVDRHLDCFRVWGFVNHATLNIGACVSFQIRVYFFPRYSPGVGLQDHMAGLFLVF